MSMAENRLDIAATELAGMILISAVAVVLAVIVAALAFVP